MPTQSFLKMRTLQESFSALVRIKFTQEFGGNTNTRKKILLATVFSESQVCASFCVYSRKKCTFGRKSSGGSDNSQRSWTRIWCRYISQYDELRFLRLIVIDAFAGYFCRIVQCKQLRGSSTRECLKAKPRFRYTFLFA